MIGERNKIILLVVPLIIVFAAVSFISLYSSSYLSVSDLRRFSNPVKVSVMGNVSKGSVRVYNGSIFFVLTDGSSQVGVYYPGVIQLDNSTSFAQVTVEGIYYPDENLINASNILFKCPSKQQIEKYNQTYSQ